MQYFNFDLLGRMRNYDTSTRKSGFNYEGSKRLGDYDDKDEEWKRFGLTIYDLLLINEKMRTADG